MPRPLASGEGAGASSHSPTCTLPRREYWAYVFKQAAIVSSRPRSPSMESRFMTNVDRPLCSYNE
eukprot:scaffold7382_cov406-Prasinococcus_capsulatus_cf.AAC.21